VLSPSPSFRINEVEAQSSGKGDLKASGKYDMPSIYCGAILFTIETIVNLLVVVRELGGLQHSCRPPAQGTRPMD
jgi:hypothetical protein